ncbi:MAG: hypothetical protein PHG02_02110 [Oscillospiraceae bacterium]|nr:hypothetical protein [Oscillospiraceae bacterium]
MTTTLLGSGGIMDAGLQHGHLFSYVYTRQNRHRALCAKHQLVVYCPPENLTLKSTAIAIKRDVAFLTRLSYEKLVVVFQQQTHGLGVHLKEITRQDNCLTVTLPQVFLPATKPEAVLAAMAAPVLLQLTCLQYNTLAAQSSLIKNTYFCGQDGCYTLQPLDDNQTREKLICFFKTHIFQESYSLLYGGQLLSHYQFYPLRYLWRDINIALQANRNSIMLAAAPVTPARLYRAVYGTAWQGKLALQAQAQLMQSDTCDVCGGRDGFYMSQEQILQELTDYMRACIRENYF